ncbi:MAG: hypothetical protein IRY88_12150 [Rubrobacteraceae bacterium]|nr:hypothetical protein [Rubrobacteraceae bacterium]
MAIDPDDFAAQVNYLAAIGRMIVPRALAFLGQEILFTGYGPFNEEDLAELLPEGARYYIAYVDEYVSDVPEDVAFDLVVVGRTSYSEEAITDAIDRGVSHRGSFRRKGSWMSYSSGTTGGTSM